MGDPHWYARVVQTADGRKLDFGSAAANLHAAYGDAGVRVVFTYRPERSLGPLEICVGVGDLAYVSFWDYDKMQWPDQLAEATRSCVRSWAVNLSRALRREGE